MKLLHYYYYYYYWALIHSLHFSNQITTVTPSSLDIGASVKVSGQASTPRRGGLQPEQRLWQGSIVCIPLIAILCIHTHVCLSSEYHWWSLQLLLHLLALLLLLRENCCCHKWWAATKLWHETICKLVITQLFKHSQLILLPANCSENVNPRWRHRVTTITRCCARWWQQRWKWWWP